LTPVSILADIYIQIFTFLGIYTIIKHKYYNQKKVNFLIVSIVILILSSFISSKLILKQDNVSALIATQHIFKGFSVFYFIQNIKTNKINLKFVFKNLIKLVWIFTLFLTFASLTGFAFTFTSPISGSKILITANKYAINILYFGEMYFLAKYFKTGKFANLIYLSLIFISTQLYDIQRGDIIFMFAILAICLFLYRKTLSATKIYLIAPIFLVLVVASFNNSETSNKINNKFTQMLMVFNSEETGKINDASIFVRLREIEFAISGFMENPISGKGLIRSSKQKELIGDIYFYPGDVGIYGILFTFGLVGIFVFSYFIRWVIKIKYNKLNLIFSGFYVYTIYSLMYTLKDGFIMLSPTQFIFCIMLIKLSQDYSLENRNHVAITK
jgi:hypothetical protein